MKHIVKGMLLYYPYKDGKETRPVGFVPFANLSKNSQEKRILESSSSSANVINLAEDSESGCDQNEVIETRGLTQTVSVYWQNRCVPDSFAQRLPFFPMAKTNLECSNAQLPMLWRNRIKCYLFFDNKFSNISNNKLHLLFGGQGLESWFEQNKKVCQ